MQSRDELRQRMMELSLDVRFSEDRTCASTEQNMQLFRKDHAMGSRRSTRGNFFSKHLRETVFLCTVFSLGPGVLVAQTAAPGVAAPDSQQQAAPQEKSQQPQMGSVNT